MTKSDFSNYLLKRLQGVNSTTGSKKSELNIQDLGKNLSIFGASKSDVENFDYEAALKEMTEEGAVEGKTDSNDTLKQIVQGLFEIKDIQELADSDGDGKISNTEAQALIEGLMGNDGNADDLTISDIDKAIESLGIDLEDTASDAIEEAAKQLDEIEEAENNKAAEKAAESSPASAAGGANSAGNAAGANNAAKTNQTAPKTAAETLEELEQKKQEIIKEADSNIQAKEQEKDKLVEESDKIDDDLKKEYADAKKDLNETTKKKTNLESKRDGYDSDIAGVERDISSLEGEKGSLQTNTEDDDINAQNKARLGDIEKEISSKQEKKTELENKKQEAEEQIKELEKKEEEQQKKLEEVEAKIAKADPELGKKMEKINGEIQELKTQKDADVKDIDAQIKAKKEEAKEEAKQKGESKGRAANSNGQATADFALGYDGKSAEEMKKIMREKGYQFDDGAWCADFVSFSLSQSKGEENLPDWYKNCGNRAYCPTIEDAARNAGAVVDASQAQVGDAVTFTRHGRSGHIGIISKIDADGTIHTIEGNTSDDNGHYSSGVVNEHTYRPDQIRAFLSMKK